MSTATMKSRSDLVISAQDGPGGPVFVMKDPASSRFFRFKEIEHFIAQQFGGVTPPETVRQPVKERPGITFAGENLEQFANRFHRIGAATKKPLGRCTAASSGLILPATP